MPLGNKVFILIAVSVAVTIACLVATLLCCVYRICNKRTARKRKDGVVDIEMMYNGYGPLTTTVLVMENEQQVAIRAFQDSGNVVWTNEGKVFHKVAGHPEETFISTNKEPQAITSIYIKNSPCSACSSKLVAHFANCQPKPTIYIGKISHLRDPSHKKGLQHLLKNGFEIQVWQTLHDLMFSTKMTENYIQKLKK